jgi:hypothetical protein
MPGSKTTPGRNRPRVFATVRIAFRHRDVVGARDYCSFAAQWLACASPCRRFAADLAVVSARLGAGAVRETFTVKDFHLILPAGLPAHIAVGTRIAERPPHRAVRARFGHTAPTLGV